MFSAIETKGLSRRFGRVHAVEDISFTVPCGQVFALIGPNGAGKTTIIQLLMNLLRPSSGASWLLGTKSSHLGPAALRRIGFVAESQRLPRSWTVRQLLAFCRPLYPAWDDLFARQLLELFELPLDRPCSKMSRGMYVKTALLCAMAFRPRLLVLDEPFSGLDPLVRDELTDGVLRVTETQDWTVFISSHDIDEVERLADSVGFLESGRLRLVEPVSSLQRRFRIVEALVNTGSRQPPEWPATWMEPQLGDGVLRFLDSSWDPIESPVRIRALFPDASDVSDTEVSLRAIFVAAARRWRTMNKSGGPA